MSQPPIAPTDEADSAELLDRGYGLVGAVHRLLSVTRMANKLDLVLAAATLALRDGDKTVREIADLVHQVWPGAVVDSATVEAALQLGVELGVVLAQASLGDATLWQLTARGVTEVQEQERWVAGVRGAAVEALRARAESGLGVRPSQETAELWLERIVGALIGGITAAQDAYLGQVDHVLQRRLAPRGFDQHKVIDLIKDARSEPAILEFLTACALAALDPLDPFASDLVSHITIGCVLHSYVAGRDAAKVLGAVGAPVGQRALLDTPILVELIGPARVSEKLEVSIEAATSGGWEVVVCEHSIEELIALIQREIPNIKGAFTQAHAAGVKEEWYASLVENQLPSYCVEALRDGKYQTLDEMQEAAAQVRVRLANLGVEVRQHFNEKDGDRVERCRRALVEELEGRGERSDAVLQRDADSMAMVWRRRRRELRGSAWPGGWVITPDRHMSNAYRAAAPGDTTRLTLTMSQWSTLCSLTVPPADVVALAEAAATQLVEEAMWLLPSRFPSDVALELARQISPERGGSDTDLRYAQLTLDAALAMAESQSATSMAADVLEARSRRRDALRTQEMVRATTAANRAQAEAAAATELARLKDVDAQSARRAAEAADRRAADLEATIQWERTRTRRIAVSLVIGFLGILLVAGTILIGAHSLAIGTLVVALGVWSVAAWRWCAKQDARVLPLFVAAAIEAVGLAASLVQLVDGIS